MAKVNYQEMSEHDLLVAMLKAQEKDARRGLASAIAGFTLAAVFAVEGRTFQSAARSIRRNDSAGGVHTRFGRDSQGQRGSKGSRVHYDRKEFQDRRGIGRH